MAVHESVFGSYFSQCAVTAEAAMPSWGSGRRASPPTAYRPPCSPARPGVIRY